MDNVPKVTPDEASVASEELIHVHDTREAADKMAKQSLENFIVCLYLIKFCNGTS